MAGETPSAPGTEPRPTAAHIPIAELTPLLSDPSARTIKAIVTLIWPFSSITGSLTVLLAEPDFRLRRTRGQVRVHFAGSSARKVIDVKIGSSDEVELSLDGAEWIKDDFAAGQTPGRGIEWELKFTERLRLQIREAESQATSLINVDHPTSTAPEPVVETVVTYPAITETETLPLSTAPHLIKSEATEWFSPAFVKRARVSYGSLLGSGYDLFMDEDSSYGAKSRKRTKFGRESGAWRYNSRSPSPHVTSPVGASDISTGDKRPEMMDEGCQTMDLEGGVAEALADMSRQSTSAGREVRRTLSSFEPTDDGYDQEDSSNMSPPLSRLRTNVQKVAGEQTETALSSVAAPISPRLEPLSSDGLPLISPLVSTAIHTFPQINSGFDQRAAELVGDDDIQGNAYKKIRSDTELDASNAEEAYRRSSKAEDVQTTSTFREAHASAEQDGWQSPIAQYNQANNFLQPYSLNKEDDRNRIYHEPNSAHGIGDESVVEPGSHDNDQAYNTTSAALQPYSYPDVDIGYANTQSSLQWGADVREALYPHAPLQPKSRIPNNSDFVEFGGSFRGGTTANRSRSESLQSHEDALSLKEEYDASEDQVVEGGDVELLRTAGHSPVESSMDDSDQAPQEDNSATPDESEYSGDDYGIDEDIDEDIGDTYPPGFIPGYERGGDFSTDEEDDERSEGEDDESNISEDVEASKIGQPPQRSSPEVIDLLSDSDDEVPNVVPNPRIPPVLKSRAMSPESELGEEDETNFSPLSQPEGAIESNEEVESWQTNHSAYSHKPIDEIEQSEASPKDIPSDAKETVLETEGGAQHEIGAKPQDRVENDGTVTEHSVWLPTEAKSGDDVYDSSIDSDHSLAVRSSVYQREQISTAEEIVRYPVLPVDSVSEQVEPMHLNPADAAVGKFSEYRAALTQLPTPEATQSNLEAIVDSVSTFGSSKSMPLANVHSLSDTVLAVPHHNEHRLSPKAGTSYEDEPQGGDDSTVLLVPNSPDHRSSPVTPHSGQADRSSSLVIDGPTTPYSYDGSADLALHPMGSPSKDVPREHQAPDKDLRLRLTKSLRSNLGDFTLLKVLRFHMEKKLDVLAIVTTCPPEAERAKTGPRNYHLRFNVTDASIAPSAVTEIQIFRAWKEALPIVKAGDGILLRHFNVKSEKGRGFLLRSNDESSWAVFKGDEIPQMKGPPVEFGDEEDQYIADLRTWYGNLDAASRSKLDKANAAKGGSASKGKAKEI